jgi:hypothetical protein
MIDTHNPLTKTTTHAPEGLPKQTVSGVAPKPHMAVPGQVDLRMTDITQEEMTAGKKASDFYSQRRQAELDYGGKFMERRMAKIKEIPKT